MSRYGIKSVDVGIQGEGMRTGTKVVFIRFSGCNRWDGHPLHRKQGDSLCAKWCDADFHKGQALGEEDILSLANNAWGRNWGEKWCVLTGGEPTEQIDHELMAALHDDGWLVALETNGTERNAAALEANHVCLSPQLALDGTPWPLVFEHADEIKVVLPGGTYEQPGWTPGLLSAFEMVAHKKWPRARLYVQPQDPLLMPDLVGETALVRTAARPDVFHAEHIREMYLKHVKVCVDHVMANPRWSLSLQTQKLAGLP